MHSLRNQLLYTDFFFLILQFLYGYVDNDRNSVISFVEWLLKLVFYLFVLALCNNVFGMSVVSNDKNRCMIFFGTYLSTNENLFLVLDLERGRFTIDLFPNCHA